MSSEREQVEAFLYLEARLMDENRYDDWLALFADECTYWIPSNAEDTDPGRQVSIIYADRRVLANHVRRLVEGRAYAQQPRSRMRRIVGNVEVDRSEDELVVRANFAITEIRSNTQRLHTGQSVYRLLPHGETFLIASKKVNLVAIDAHHDNLTFLL